MVCRNAHGKDLNLRFEPELPPNIHDTCPVRFSVLSTASLPNWRKLDIAHPLALRIHSKISPPRLSSHFPQAAHKPNHRLQSPPL
jgi:hypothetical protein